MEELFYKLEEEIGEQNRYVGFSMYGGVGDYPRYGYLIIGMIFL